MRRSNRPFSKINKQKTNRKQSIINQKFNKNTLISSNGIPTSKQ